ncbi:MAG: sulfate adenylyltransferase subunit CysD [Candidatus Aenigmatarchaeota archaeon]
MLAAKSETDLAELENKSIFILREVKSRFKKPAVLWSTGKDSTTMLWLIKRAFFGEIPFPVIHIDTGYKPPEIYQFRDKLAKEWGFNLLVAKNDAEIEKGTSPFTTSKFDCCTRLKTMALKQLIEKERFDAIIVSIRRDEHGIRSYERYMSPRDKEFRWKIFQKEAARTGDSGFKSLQDTELSGWMLFETDFGPECNHVRVHPILHWCEIDVWRYIRQEKMPINPLYYSRNGERYRSLGCKPCTNPIKSDASSIDEIITELETTSEEERAGRAQDKEDEYTMQKLRALGYM